MGVVVPDTLLTSPAYRRVREWLLSHLAIRALVALPSSALALIGYSGTASVLVLEKLGPNTVEAQVLIADLEVVGEGSDEEREKGRLHHAVATLSDYLQGRIPASELSQQGGIQLTERKKLHPSRLDARLWAGSASLARTKYPTATLGELAEIFGGRNYKKHIPPGPEAALLIQAGTVRELHLDTSDPRYISQSDYAAAGRVQLRPGDVLATTTGQYLGRSAVFEDTGSSATISGAVTVLRPNERVTSQYLAALLNSPIVREQIEQLQAASTAQPYIRRADLARVVVPVPPIPVQQEIAREVVELKREAHELAQRAQRLEDKAKNLVLNILESDRDE